VVALCLAALCCDNVQALLQTSHMYEHAKKDFKNYGINGVCLTRRYHRGVW
jgi:hypothetical protein